MESYSKFRSAVILWVIVMAPNCLAQAYPKKDLPTSTTVVMTTPTPEQVFAPGDTITVTLVPVQGASIPGGAAVGVSSNDWDSGPSLFTQPPYVANFYIPKTECGRVDVLAIVLDSTRTAEISRSIVVVPSATLQSLTIGPTATETWKNKLTLGGIGEMEQLAVTGNFSDGIARDITDYQTDYASTNPHVATVSNTGAVVAVKNGTTRIVVKHGGLMASLQVTVKFQKPELESVFISTVSAGQSVNLWVRGKYLGGASRIAFLTPAGVPDKNIVASGLKVSQFGGLLSVNVALVLVP